ncbi:MAG TPA: efflux RND transporter periplasmic adaptor subunit [Tepidisphaeraceae bacterium]|nr:efflux RND transporter periplasmic adaptor subunit [Tepidisphaeraceae bacterium]
MKNTRATITAMVLGLAGLVGVGIGLDMAIASSKASPSQQATTQTAKPSPSKQLYHCGMHPQIIQDHPGNCPICHMALTPMKLGSSASATGERNILYWWDPMLGPSSISNKPGVSAMGMDLVAVYADQAGPGVTIDPAVVQNMGVRTAQVTRGPIVRSLRAVGVLKTPEPGMYDVSLKVGGWIDKLYVNENGMHVTRGQPLFDLYSPDLQVAGEELISATKSQGALPANASPALRREAQNMIDSARRKLRLWDVAEQDIAAIAKADHPPKDIPFRSPATGHVQDKAIVEGSAVQPMTKLLRIEDHSKMWLDAQVYEEQIPWIKMGQPVRATVDSMPGKTWKGAISFIYPHLDHMTRTLSVRMTLDNPDFALKPGMYAGADIQTQPVADAIQVPREAVIDTGVRQIAFIADANGHFTPRKVRMGLMGDDDLVQIVQGLAPGEIVVTSGQFLMDVESRTIEATQKFAEGPANSLGAPQATSTAPPSLAELMPVTAPTTQDSEIPQTQPMPNTGMMPNMRPMPDMEPAPQTQPMPRSDMAPMPKQLSVAYCPMAKKNWLQIGTDIANPYLGPAMATCGNVRGTLRAPTPGKPLAPVVNAYLILANRLGAGQFDPAAAHAFAATTDKLVGDPYAGLRADAAKLAQASDLKAARAAFGSVSDRLIDALAGSK